MKLRVKRIIFVAVMCVGALCAGLLRWPIHFQTDLTSLLNIENDAGWPIQSITDTFSSVVNVVVQASDRMDGEIAAHKIRDAVTADFPDASILVNNFSPRDFISTIGKYHNAMIGATDRKLLQEHRFADITNNARVHVETSVSPNMLPLSQDPFLLFTTYVSEIGNAGTNWIAQNGVLWQYKAPYNFYMLPIRLHVSDNAKLVDITEQLKSVIADNKSENVEIYMGGAPLHSAEMYQHTKAELGIISVLALIAVILLNYMLFRSMATIIPIGISLLVGYIAGTIALFLCFNAPHILVFVFGTSLIGLGIDYGFHFMYIGAKDDIKAVHKNIVYSLITTLICFVPLGFASIGLLRQISVFTIIGLGAIYAFIKLFVSNKVAYVPKKMPSVRSLNARYRPYVICAIAVFTVVACAFVRIENNMAAMYRPKGELAVSERVIGELNQSDKSAFLIVRGRDTQEMLRTEEAIRDSGVRFFGVSSVVPSLARQSENNELVRALFESQSTKIKKALELRKKVQFVPAEPLTIDNADLGALRSQIEQLLVKTDGYVYSVSSVAADTVVENENARVIAPSHQIQTQMEKYSHETYRLLIICGIVLILGLMVLYGRRAARYLMPPLFGVGVSVALLTIFGMPMTFFHLLGLFIIIGLGMDYAIFHMSVKHSTELRPVFYSFLTSFIGFGLLAFTSFFLIAALGMILAIGIAVSYFVSLYLFRNQ